MTEAAVTPWLHVTLACALFLLMAGAAARPSDRESAYALVVIGTLLLLFVAAEHGVLGALRGRWPCPHYTPHPDHGR